MADARDLKSREGYPSCGFESRLGYCETTGEAVEDSMGTTGCVEPSTEGPKGADLDKMPGRAAMGCNKMQPVSQTTAQTKDTRLAQLVERWESLPEAIREKIAELVKG